MGYYTTFKLEIISGDNGVTDYEEAISLTTDYSNCFGDSIKWYSHEEDMRKFSKLHPKTVFMLTGEGEESGDIWREYYLGGKMQRAKAKIIFDDFDKTKLI